MECKKDADAPDAKQQDDGRDKCKFSFYKKPAYQEEDNDYQQYRETKPHKRNKPPAVGVNSRCKAGQEEEECCRNVEEDEEAFGKLVNLTGHGTNFVYFFALMQKVTKKIKAEAKWLKITALSFS
jgi:hypothetical protein